MAESNSAPVPGPAYKRIDHIALAVADLEESISLFVDVLGFKLRHRRTTQGAQSGMISAEVVHKDITFVLCQGTTPDSQVSRLVSRRGPGIAHVALEVSDVVETHAMLARRGMDFDTSVIASGGLRQVFSTRDANSGMSFEFIERSGESGFVDENVDELFAQLERNNSY